MKSSFSASAMLLAAFCFIAPATSAVLIKPVPATAEIKLAEGINDVKVGDLTVRIVKGFMSDLTANSYTTYTPYIMPTKKGEHWLNIDSQDLKGNTLTWTTTESGDSNLRSVAFYTSGGELFAVQAVKVGVPYPDIKMKKASLEIRVSKFNQDVDVPLFTLEGIMTPKTKYLEAAEGLKKEFFSAK